MQKFFQGGGGGGGGSLCEVLHSTLDRGGENDTRGDKCPSRPPLNTALQVTDVTNHEHEWQL